MNQSKNGPKNEIDISPKKTYRWLLMRVKEGSDKLNIQKTKIMASGVPTLNANRWKKVEAVIDFIFLGSKITAEDDRIHDIKRHLLLGRKAMTNLDSIIKSRDITLLTKIHIVKDRVLPIAMYSCESWTIKKAKH